MYSEEDLLPISALQHLAFCERQWALIHLEGIWQENPLTVEGNYLHDRVDETETEVRGNLRIARGLRLRSLRLGLVGKADVVEFHRLQKKEEGGLTLEGVDGQWKPLIVEYKHGQPKIDHCDEVQICAQALCLEEMLNVSAKTASIFYGKPRRRYDVTLDSSLRQETESLTNRLHELTAAAKTPPAHRSKKCKNCSLSHICLPKAVGKQKSAEQYLEMAISEAQEEET
ncbi:MAG: CRISPR-associated protein Cas4 [Dehalococcoidia bacterium]